MDFLALRLIDDQWSRDVQEGRCAFDPVIARGLHRLYEVWWEQAGKGLRDDHPDRLVAQSIMMVPVEDLIESHAEMERGETVTYEPTTDLSSLVESARTVKMTPEEAEAQRQSFVRGNLAVDAEGDRPTE